MPGNPLVRFDEGRVGRTQVSPSLLLYRPIVFFSPSEGAVYSISFFLRNQSRRMSRRRPASLGNWRPVVRRFSGVD